VLPGLGYASAGAGAGARFDRWVQLWGVRSAAKMPASRTVFQNESDRAVVLGNGALSHRAGRLIHGWGVDLNRFSRPLRQADPPVVLMVSRMLWAKGVGEFVEAAKSCRARANIRFALVGDTDTGNPTHVPRRQLEMWREEGAVEWWGHRDDIPDLLAGATVVVLPTRYGEGAPQSLIEACAAGVPVVASDLPGCREVVEQGVNGYLVPPGDVRGLTEAIAQIVADPDLQARMGAHGRAIAHDRFSVGHILADYLEVYRELGLEASVAR
jgi:glycosyltransferase involved in cell wall biosynthesis